MSLAGCGWHLRKRFNFAIYVIVRGGLWEQGMSPSKDPWEIEVHVFGELVCGILNGSWVMKMSAVRKGDSRSEVMTCYFFLEVFSVIHILYQV